MNTVAPVTKSVSLALTIWFLPSIFLRLVASVKSTTLLPPVWSFIVSSLFCTFSIFPAITILLIFTIINLIQEDACAMKFPNYADRVNCKTIMDYLGENISYILFVAAIIFNYFFFSIVRKWKAKPEN